MKQKILKILEFSGVVLGSDFLPSHILGTEEMEPRKQFVAGKLFCWSLSERLLSTYHTPRPVLRPRSSVCVWKCAQGLREAVFPERLHAQHRVSIYVGTHVAAWVDVRSSARPFLGRAGSRKCCSVVFSSWSWYKEIWGQAWSFFLFFLKNSLSSKFNNCVRIPLGCNLLLLLCEPLSLSNQGCCLLGLRKVFLNCINKALSWSCPWGSTHALQPSFVWRLGLLFFPLMFEKPLSPLGLGCSPHCYLPHRRLLWPLLAHIQVFCPTPTFSKFFKLIFQFSLFSSCLFPESFLLCDFSFLNKLLHLIFKIHCKILGQKFHVTQWQHFSLTSRQ